MTTREYIESMCTMIDTAMRDMGITGGRVVGGTFNSGMLTCVCESNTPISQDKIDQLADWIRSRGAYDVQTQSTSRVLIVAVS